MKIKSLLILSLLDRTLPFLFSKQYLFFNYIHPAVTYLRKPYITYESLTYLYKPLIFLYLMCLHLPKYTLKL